MGRRLIRGLVVVAAMLIAAPAVRALETDQFTPPPAPLPDVAPYFQQHMRILLQKTASQANIDALRQHRRRFDTITLQDGDQLAERFRKLIASGVFEDDVEVWLRSSKFPCSPHIFAPEMGESIYGNNPLAKPVTLVMLSPTVRLFDTYLGTDKIGHFIEQGFEYYQVFRHAEDSRLDIPVCVRKALELGVYEEKNYFGLLMVGVYSNADLAANYSGFKFYLNLTRPVQINGRRLEPLLVKRDGLWEINPDLPTDFMRPFISDHLNEALNPSFYNDQLRETVRANFHDRATRWLAFYRLDPETDQARSRALSSFYGEPYGHSGMEGIMTVAEMIAAERPAVAQHVVPGSPRVQSR